MGGMLSKMKITGYTMLIGSAALAGIPITSGYYSKDAILEAALQYGLGSGDLLPYLMGLFTVLLTALYIFRAWFMTFVGKSRLPKGREPHEAPWLMTVPLMILAFCSIVFAGAVNSWFGGKIFVEYVGRTFDKVVDVGALSSMGGYHLMEVHVEHTFLMLPLALAFVGVLIAGMLYWAKKPDPESIVSPTNPIYRLLITKYYELPIIDFISMRITMGIAILTKVVERIFIDGSIWLITKGGFLFGEILRRAQSGVVRHYASAVALGIGLLIIGLWGWL